jgi:XTP/dITP diphosphohydrolase
MRIYVATSNRGKLGDFATAAKEYGIDVLPLSGIFDMEAPEETGSTFEENARIKAEYYSEKMPGEIVIADDSGLTVDALGGAPGVRSARYAADAGIRADNHDEANNNLLLRNSESIPDSERSCAFVAVIAAARDAKTLQTFAGRADGILLRQPRGSNGFGYDPLFCFPSIGKSFAELPPEEKLKFSHRGEAFRKLLEWINKGRERDERR